ncbi:MAG: MFS transporter, partial [Brevundimonas sp.]
MSAPRPAASPTGTGALGVLFTVVFLNLVGFGLVIPLLPFFGESLGAPTWQVTFLLSAFSLVVL